MPKFFLIFTGITSIFLISCATYIRNPEKEEIPKGVVNGVKLENSNKDTAPRIFFTDGITTIKSDYSKWTNILLSRYEIYQKTNNESKSNGRFIKVSFHSIACSGSFITNCIAVVVAERSDGVSNSYSTENIYGYGWSATMDRLINDLAIKMANDSLLNEFIY